MDHGNIVTNILLPVRRSAQLLIITAAVFSCNVYADLVTDTGFNDDPFEEYYLRPCIDGSIVLLGRGWSNQEIIDYNNEICNVVFNAGTFNGSDTYSSSSNLGSKGAQSKATNTAASQQVSGVKDRMEELEEEVSPQGGWGVLAALQRGEAERVATNSESGFESDLEGVVLGGDYRFNDALVVGFATGYTNDEADFDNNSGTLKTTSNALTVYLTYTPIENAYIDGYIGLTSLEFSGLRKLVIEGEPADAFGFSGAATSDFDGNQTLLGISGGYDWYYGNLSVGPYMSIDYNKTDVDGYDEQGTTNLELRYPDQTTHSRLSALGVNLKYAYGYDWGYLVPSFSIAWMHEAKDDARSFDVRLLALPAVDPSTLQLQTDAPDRDYGLISLGVVAAMNKGVQLFATYEQSMGHDFLDTWVISTGLLAEF